MEVGVEVWVKDVKGDESWIAAEVRSKEYSEEGKLTLIVEDEYGEEFQFTLTDENEELENIKLKNDPSEMKVDNLISLPYLHEPAILYCLQQRYSNSDIYTYTGPILIAMNPFKKVPLYTNQILEVYYNEGLLKSQGIESGNHLPPHVYAIADAAYREMMRVIMSGFSSSTSSAKSPHGNTSTSGLGSANHSILISGESGAGKTESTKIVLRYLTTVGNSTGDMAVESGSVMDKVLQSNPILEAFGNARTLRNDNSSRFGKFIELSFNKRGHLIGGVIRTYLLEKVRLPSQQRGERNFHIFYQLAAGATAEELARWGIEAIEDFEYVLRGGIFKLQSMDDAEEFAQLKHALSTLNFDAQDQASLLDVTAALLHLGQVSFRGVHDAEGEGSAVAGDADSQASLERAAKLLGLDAGRIASTLTVRTIVAREETYLKKLTPQQASDARDALAKVIYGHLFEWIVRTINLSIVVESKLVRSSIGVLDIFGFECFEHNSFEQLCINYTNETLQQQFNQYIFKMEQIEYQKEKIEWSFIEFPDNQDCLDLIEHKVSGILAMLDDECRLGQASDVKFASRMYKAYEKNPRFLVTPPQRRDHKFCVRHYAGAVVYSTITFVEKNKDEVPKEATALLQSSSLPLLSALFSNVGFAGADANASQPPPSRRRDGSNDGGAGLSKMKSTNTIASMNSVGTQFKEQLHTLMESIYATTPHYIRCLKPNDENVSDNFNRVRITEQLRYGGVLEAVRVARSGFPVRLSHLDFYARYRALANPYSTASQGLPAFCHKETVTTEGMKALCDQLICALWDETLPAERSTSTEVVVGPDGERVLVPSSKRRSRMADMSAWQSKSSIAKQSVQLGLTKVFLRKPAHDVLESRRSRRITSAARRIQCQFRCQQVRKWYVNYLGAVRLVQRITRGMLARSRARAIRALQSAIKIQRQYRRFYHQSRYWLLLRGVVLLQCQFRGVRSKRLVGAMRQQVHAVRLQRLLRGVLQTYRWRRYRKALVALQNRFRKGRAKAQLRALRIAAKDVGKLKQSNEALKSEIDALKARAAEERERMRLEMEKSLQNKAETAKAEEFNNLKVELENAYKLLEIERTLHQQALARLVVAENKLRKVHYDKGVASEDVSTHDQHHHYQHQQGGSGSSEKAMEQRLLQSEEALAAAMARINFLEQGGVTSPYSPRDSQDTSSLSSLSQSMRHVPLSLKTPAPSRRQTAPQLPPSYMDMTPMHPTLPPSSTAVPAPPQHTRRHSRGNSSGTASSTAAVATSAAAPSIVSGRSSLSEKRRTSFSIAQQEALRASIIAQDPFFKHDPEHTALREALEGERLAKEALEAEVSRLRHISMDYKAQLDSLRRATGSAAPPTTPAAPHHMAVQAPEGAASLLSIPVPGSGHKRIPMAARGRYSTTPRAPASHSSAATGATSSKPSFGLHIAVPPAAVDASQWPDTWEEDGVSTGGTPHGNLSNNSSMKYMPENSPKSDVSEHNNPLATKRAGHTGVASASAGQSRLSASTLAHAATAKAILANPEEVASAVRTFERNMAEFRTRLKQGVKCTVWEGQKVSNAEAYLKLDPSGKLLLFDTSQSKRGGFAFFQSRVDIAPIGIVEVAEVLAGAELFATEASDQSLLVTVVCKATHHGSRILAVMFGNKDGRNFMLNGLRTLCADANLAPAAKVGAAVGVGVDAQSKQQQQQQRPTRRLTMREVVLEERAAQQAASSSAAAFNKSGSRSDAASSSGDMSGSPVALQEVQKVLMDEQQKNGKILMQLVVMTNELNERDNQIALLKKKEEHYEQTLAERENLFKQDTMVRMQLGKRLEQVLMDKGEAQEQLEALREQLAALTNNVR